MSSILSALAKGVRAAIAFLAVLCVLASPLEASACATEGCGATCLDQAADVAADLVASNADDTSSDDCAKSNCPCITAHCAHTAVLSAPGAATMISVSRIASVHLAAVDLVSGTLQTPDRPPRV